MNIKRETFLEILRFGVVGVIATAIHYGVYYLLHDMIDVNLAYTTGYVVSFVVNYLLSACYTFKKRTSVKNGIGFMGAHAFNYLLQVSLLNLFMWLGVDKTFAPIPVYCVAIPTNFLIVRFVFHRK